MSKLSKHWSISINSLLFSIWLHSVSYLIISSNFSVKTHHSRNVSDISVFFLRVAVHGAGPARCLGSWSALLLYMCSLCLPCAPFILKVFYEPPRKQSHQCPILASVNPTLNSTNLFLRCAWFLFCLFVYWIVSRLVRQLKSYWCGVDTSWLISAPMHNNGTAEKKSLPQRDKNLIEFLKGEGWLFENSPRVQHGDRR